MEFLNKVELCGIVGAIHPHYNVMNTPITQFSLCVDTIGKNHDGVIVIDSQWFVCTIHQTLEIHKGDKVHVLGRLSTKKYTDSNGNERTISEVICNTVEKV